jgi:hypothetical protein
MAKFNIKQFDCIKKIDEVFRPTLEQIGEIRGDDEFTRMTAGSSDIKLFYRLTCTREDLYKGYEGCVDVTLDVKSDTACIDVKLHDYFDEYFEIDDSEGDGLDGQCDPRENSEWVFLQQPCEGGAIYAMSKIEFRTHGELFRELTQRMSCFSDPDFIEAMTLGR